MTILENIRNKTPLSFGEGAGGEALPSSTKETSLPDSLFVIEHKTKQQKSECLLGIKHF
jgi:hypothetical protein